MDRDTIIRLAREAGLEILSLDGEDEVGCGDNYHIQTDLIERFAALVAQAEREECAKVCEEFCDDPYAALTAERIRRRHQEQDMTKDDKEYHRKRGAEIVAQIRAAQVNPEYAAGVRDERKRIIDLLQEQNKHKERQNFYAYIIKLIEESAC